MDLYHDIDLQDCPLCHGPGIIEEEAGWCLYVTCLDCGCRTAELSFSTPEERLAARPAGRQLSGTSGKVIPHRRGRLSRSAPRPSRKKRPSRSMAPGRAAVFSLSLAFQPGGHLTRRGSPWDRAGSWAGCRRCPPRPAAS